MKPGLPKDGSSAREARIRKTAPAPRSKSSSGRASGPWWHQALLWLVLVASAAALNVNVHRDSGSDFAVLRSVVIDHALPAGNGDPHSAELSGASLLWSPFFLAAHAGVGIARGRGSQIPADGQSWPYRWACAFGTALYGFFALWLSYGLALRFAKPPAALVATVAIWLASALPVYLYLLPLTSHVAAMFAAALMLRLWLSIRDGQDMRSRWFIWGLAGGLAVTTSLFNSVFLIPVLVECVWNLVRPRTFVQALGNGLVFLAGAAVVVMPALAIKRQIDGAWLTSGNGPVMHWNNPQLVATAISADHGAFLWTPVLLLAAVGLIIAIRRQPAVGAVLLAVGLSLFYLVSAYDRALTDASFGSRLLIPLTPVLVAGLAALVDALVGQRGTLAWTSAIVIAICLILWNMGLMLQWGIGMIPDRGPIDFRRAAANQVREVPRAAKDFVIRYFNERKGLLSDPGHGARE